MPLDAGVRLGQYEIVAPLGAGGMGEVYRARDLRLDRTVALKALPEAFARDPERIARFEREARLLASVHHPNIAVIFGIEDRDGRSYLVIELVDGESLADRIARGPLGLAETIDLGAQIAAAITAAHDQGVVHRDLKPGNVMVTPGGIAKVLDFGLAKGAADVPAADADLSASPTVALSATAVGAILGTAPYMSPEQARGQSVDRRADVWALGCVLYECLTARQAFAGETRSDVIARILEREPDWDALPAGTPPRLRDLVRRCLTKAAADRPRDAGDLRGELLAIAADRSAPARSSGPGPGGPSVAVLYFENLSADSESDYFCAGITEDILTDLSKLKGLRVASRNAVARFRGKAVDIPFVASELGVGAVLEGSVRRAGGRVRITAQLLQSNGFHLWAERYDRTLDDVFAVQDEIAASIAGALRVALTPADTARMAQDRPADVQAYDLYLRGRAHYDQRTPEALREAMRLFTLAVEVEPDYALAWAGLGDAWGQFLQWDLATDRAEARRLGLEAARRAIALDPKLPEAHKAEALVLAFSGDRKAARESSRRAIEADPRYTPALGNFAVDCFAGGNVAGAERLFRRGLELDPHNEHLTLWLGTVSAHTGRFEEADAMHARVRALTDSQFYRTTTLLADAWVLALRGRLDDIPAALDAARADGADAASTAMLEAWLAARADRTERARRLIEDHRGGQLGFGALVFAIEAAVRIGDRATAIALLGRQVFQHLAPMLLRLNPALHTLLDEPPFAPRVHAQPLIWPLEAPMLDAARFRVFREVRIESGLPGHGDILHGL